MDEVLVRRLLQWLVAVAVRDGYEAGYPVDLLVERSRSGKSVEVIGVMTEVVKDRVGDAWLQGAYSCSGPVPVRGAADREQVALQHLQCLVEVRLAGLSAFGRAERGCRLREAGEVNRCSSHRRSGY